VYADDEFLAPHLYAAQQTYRAVDAAPFTPLDVRAFDAVAFSFHAGPSTPAS
jgi:hypothetical protein